MEWLKCKRKKLSESKTFPCNSSQLKSNYAELAYIRIPRLRCQTRLASVRNICVSQLGSSNQITGSERSYDHTKTFWLISLHNGRKKVLSVTKVWYLSGHMLRVRTNMWRPKSDHNLIISCKRIWTGVAPKSNHNPKSEHFLINNGIMFWSELRT